MDSAKRSVGGRAGSKELPGTSKYRGCGVVWCA